MASAISSFRRARMSPTRLRTSPRAGAGSVRQTANPRLALSTARWTSLAPESGNSPIRSVESAGLRFSNQAPESDAHHSPAMKLLNRFIVGKVLRVLSGQRISLDFLVEVRARHLDGAGGLGDVPVELPQLAEKVSPLGRILELLECAALREIAKAGV